MSMIYRHRDDRMVRVIHKPTGITAQATEHRSQHRNRDSAIAQLKGKIAMGAAFPLPERAVYTLPDGQPNPQDLTPFKEPAA